jgi:hypothetical protein
MPRNEKDGEKIKAIWEKTMCLKKVFKYDQAVYWVAFGARGK